MKGKMNLSSVKLKLLGQFTFIMMNAIECFYKRDVKSQQT